MNALLPYLPYVFELMQLAPKIAEALSTTTTNASTISKIRAVAPTIAPFLEQIGAQLFPAAQPWLHILGGALATYSPDLTKWLQNALNEILKLDPPLVIDGAYGPKTTAAVKRVQTMLGIAPDGIAGQVTQAGIEGLLAKL